MKLNDAVFGAIFLALSLFVLWSVRTYPTIPGQNVGPAAFPALVAGLLALCSLGLIAIGVRARDGARWFEAGAWVRSPRHVTAFLVAIGGLAVYVVAAHLIGFLIGATVFLLALLTCLRVPPGVALIVAPVATLLIHVIFYKGLRVPLPWGVLPVLY